MDEDNASVDKLDSETALAKIKVLINVYFEKVGRGEVVDSYAGEINLIHDIEEVLDNANIDTKKVIIERLELDKIKV